MGPADAEIIGCDFSPLSLLVRFFCARENEQPKLKYSVAKFFLNRNTFVTNLCHNITIKRTTEFIQEVIP